MKSLFSTITAVIGALCVLVFTFWVTSMVLDYWDTSKIDTNKIQVVEASYGSNCNVPTGNVTGKVSSACMGKVDSCSYLIDVNEIGDPAPGCAKDFSVNWRCGSPAKDHQFNLPAEANGQTVVLSCPAK